MRGPAGRGVTGQDRAMDVTLGGDMIQVSLISTIHLDHIVIQVSELPNIP